MIDFFAAIIDALFSILRPKDEFAGTLSSNTVIQSRLDAFRQVLKAGRILVFQYHNGGHFHYGYSMQKQSCSYESVSEGISSEMRTQTNLLISENPEFHTELATKGAVSWPDVSVCPLALLKADLFCRGAKSYYSHVIKNLNDDIVGHIDIDFVTGTRVLSPAELNDIANLARELSGYLSTLRSNDFWRNSLFKAATYFVVFLSLGELLDLFLRARKIFGF